MFADHAVIGVVGVDRTVGHAAFSFLKTVKKCMLSRMILPAIIHKPSVVLMPEDKHQFNGARWYDSP